jgi:predicted TIM-barrel fold metal-dependent hydrolase
MPLRGPRAGLTWLAALWLVAGAAFAGTVPVTGSKVYRQLKKDIDQIRLIDTHEHLSNEDAYLRRPADFLIRMLHYVESDLISAGMPRATGGQPLRVQDPEVPLPERWEMFQTYWREMRFTGYGRALDRVVEDLYGLDLDSVTPQTASQLNDRIAAANTAGLYRRVLKEKARIDLSIVDVGGKPDPEFFVGVRRFDHFINVRTRKELETLGAQNGVTVSALEDLVRALEVAFVKGVQDGMVGVKSGLAYSRRIHYPRPTDGEARAAFEKLKGGGDVSADDILPLQNYLMHQVCRLAGEHHLPFQIHTGLQTGSGNVITNSKPTDLVNLIMAFPDVNFVIFHGSYPYGPELSTMAKNFPNVFIDMCWLHIISPKVARESLSEWIETVPANKITGYGGDYLYVEGAYAHAEMAREVVAATLAEKVLSGYFTAADARELAVKFLRNNAVDLYRLKVPRAPAPGRD